MIFYKAWTIKRENKRITQLKDYRYIDEIVILCQEIIVDGLI